MTQWPRDEEAPDAQVTEKSCGRDTLRIVCHSSVTGSFPDRPSLGRGPTPALPAIVKH